MVTGVPLWDSCFLSGWCFACFQVSSCHPTQQMPPPHTHLQTVMHPPAHPRPGLSMTPSHLHRLLTHPALLSCWKKKSTPPPLCVSLPLSTFPSLSLPLSPSPWPGQQFLCDLRGMQTEEPSDHIIIITYQDKQLATSLFLTPSFFPESLLPHFHSLLASSPPPSRSYPTPLLPSR